MVQDKIRQVVTVLIAVVTIACSVLSVPLTGHTVGEIAQRHPVPIEPADFAFAIWGVIYLGWLAFAIYQALPAQRENPRLRRIGYWFLLSCLGNIAWEFTWLNGHVTLSLLAMLVILAPLLILYIRADMSRARASRVERWCVDIPLSIYLGWITVASIVNVAVVLANFHWNGWGISPTIWTIVLLLIATGLGIAIGVSRIDLDYLASISLPRLS